MCFGGVNTAVAPLTPPGPVRNIAAMKPPPFAYADPESVGEVLELLAEHGADAMVLAGGQSLMPELNLRRVRPGLVIDLGRVPELRELDVTDAAIVAGASVGITTLAEVHPTTAFAEAVGCIAHPQIRDRTTIGGTMAFADPSAEMPAVLVALGGSVALESIDGERRVDAADFFVGPRQTVRRVDELVTSVTLPVLDGPSVWLEVARRPSDLPLVGLFVGAHGDGWRIALCGVGPTPIRAFACEQALAAGTVDDAVDALAAELDPPDGPHASSAHRRSIAVSLLRSAVASLALAVAA